MNDPAQNPYAASISEPGEQPPHGLSNVTINSMAMTGTVITAALCMGILTFSGIVLFLKMQDLDPNQAWLQMDGVNLIYLIVGFGIFLGSLAVAAFLTSAVRRRAVRAFQSAGEALPQPLEGNSKLPVSAQTLLACEIRQTLIGQALLEGPAVVNLIFFFLSGNFPHLIPVVAGAIGILLQAPTAGRLISRLEAASHNAGRDALIR